MSIAAAKVNPTRQRFPIPWGLFIALGVYALMVVLYVYSTYWNSPGYQAARHWSDAQELLGVDEGRSCSRADLEAAFIHMLEVGRLVPEERWIHERIEAVRWRFDERKFKLDQDLKMRAEAVSGLHDRIRQSRQSFLVVGVRDRGWAPEQILEGPSKAVVWAIPGGVVICLLWAWWRFGPNRIKAQEHEAELVKQEAEVKQLGEFRNRPSGPKPTPRPKGGSRGPR
jgi:hypothetical protein